MAQLRSGRRLWRGLGVAIVVVVVIAGWVIFRPHLKRYVGTLPPEQFHSQLDPSLTTVYPGVLGVAHNAGNHAMTTTAALSHGADVIEIDVVSARGDLVAGRNQPLPGVAQQVFRGLTLAAAWKNASPAGTIKLDLKEDDRRFLDRVVAFVGPRTNQHSVMISSRSDVALLYLHARLPSVTLLYSIGSPDAIETLQADPQLRRAIGGVSVFQGLVHPGLVAWAHAHHLLVIAWTVNDVTRLNELVALGVDGITTADLAILQVLGATA